MTRNPPKVIKRPEFMVFVQTCGVTCTGMVFKFLELLSWKGRRMTIRDLMHVHHLRFVSCCRTIRTAIKLESSHVFEED